MSGGTLCLVLFPYTHPTIWSKVYPYPFRSNTWTQELNLYICPAIVAVRCVPGVGHAAAVGLVERGESDGEILLHAASVSTLGLKQESSIYIYSVECRVRGRAFVNNSVRVSITILCLSILVGSGLVGSFHFHNVLQLQIIGRNLHLDFAPRQISLASRSAPWDSQRSSRSAPATSPCLQWNSFGTGRSFRDYI